MYIYKLGYYYMLDLACINLPGAFGYINKYLCMCFACIVMYALDYVSNKSDGRCPWFMVNSQSEDSTILYLLGYDRQPNHKKQQINHKIYEILTWKTLPKQERKNHGRQPAKYLYYIWGEVTTPHVGLQEVYIWWNSKRDDGQASRRRSSPSLPTTGLRSATAEAGIY